MKTTVLSCIVLLISSINAMQKNDLAKQYVSELNRLTEELQKRGHDPMLPAFDNEGEPTTPNDDLLFLWQYLETLKAARFNEQKAALDALDFQSHLSHLRMHLINKPS